MSVTLDADPKQTGDGSSYHQQPNIVEGYPPKTDRKHLKWLWLYW